MTEDQKNFAAGRPEGKTLAGTLLAGMKALPACFRRMKHGVQIRNSIPFEGRIRVCSGPFSGRLDYGKKRGSSMNFEEVKRQEQENLMPTYGRFPVALVYGKGAVAVDTEGKLSLIHI